MSISVLAISFDAHNASSVTKMGHYRQPFVVKRPTRMYRSV